MPISLNAANIFKVAPSSDHLPEERVCLFSSKMAQSMDVAELMNPKVEKNEKMKSYRSVRYDNTLASSLTMNACHYYSPEEHRVYLACSRNVLELDTRKNWDAVALPRAMIDGIQIKMPDGSVTNYAYGQEIEIPQDFVQLNIKFSVLIRFTYLFTKKRNEMKLAEAEKEAATARHIAELEAKRAKAEAEKAKTEQERANAEAARAKTEQERAEEAEAKRRLEEEFTERTILTITKETLIK